MLSSPVSLALDDVITGDTAISFHNAVGIQLRECAAGHDNSTRYTQIVLLDDAGRSVVINAFHRSPFHVESDTPIFVRTPSFAEAA